MAPLKLASGCDRRCSFCAIPSFRGSFVSRRPSDVLQEGQWLATQGVKELFLVSENSTSYGKDLGDLRLLETLLPELSGIDGIERVRVSYLQPAETRPGLIEAIADTPGVVPYFDLSFQHASATVLRRMRRFGDPESFLDLLARIRSLAPLAGVRSNVIVGFPGETDEDLQTLCDFLEAARMDVTGVFGYSDEDGTEAAGFADDLKLDEDEIRARTEHVTGLVEELNAQRAEERIGEQVVVLVESVEDDAVEGRAAHQGPEVDGTTIARPAPHGARVGDLLTATVAGTDGVDLVARVDGATDDDRRRPARAPPGLELEHRQRADRPAHRDGAALRLGAAARRRQRPAVALGRVRPLRRRDDHRQDRRRPRAQARPDHRLRQDRRPDRRQGDHRHGLHRPLDRRRHLVVGHVVVLLREWGVTLLRLSVLKQVVIPAAP